MTIRGNRTFFIVFIHEKTTVSYLIRLSAVRTLGPINVPNIKPGVSEWEHWRWRRFFVIVGRSQYVKG
jgi:hypothetical protein